MDADRWREVLEKINAGEMPPKKEKKPSIEEIAAFVSTLDAQIKAGRAAPDGGPTARGALSPQPEGIPEHGL